MSNITDIEMLITDRIVDVMKERFGTYYWKIGSARRLNSFEKLEEEVVKIGGYDIFVGLFRKWDDNLFVPECLRVCSFDVGDECIYLRCNDDDDDDRDELLYGFESSKIVNTYEEALSNYNGTMYCLFTSEEECKKACDVLNARSELKMMITTTKDGEIVRKGSLMNLT